MDKFKNAAEIRERISAHIKFLFNINPKVNNSGVDITMTGLFYFKSADHGIQFLGKQR